MNDLVRVVEGEVVEEMALAPAERALTLTPAARQRLTAADIFGRVWDDAYEHEQDAMLRAWGALRPTWLETVTHKSGSEHTIRSYIRALDAWWVFIGAEPWLVSDKRRPAAEEALRARGVMRYTLPWEATGAHVVAWMHEMREDGKSPATINQYMAGVSSFYSFISRSTQMVNGVEVSLFSDADGHPRMNPFKHANVRRPHVTQYEKSRPMTLEQVRALRSAINGTPAATPEEYARQMRPCAGRALVNARDHALIATLLLTGRRSAEVAQLRWGDIEPGPEPGMYVFKWTGKGAKSDIQPLAPEAYWYIVGWLKAAGRWEPAPGEYIFTPINDTCAGHFHGGEVPTSKGHISPAQIGNVVKKLARRAGLPVTLIHTHTFRHTFAYWFNKNRGDMKQLQRLLGHSNIATTGIYLSSPGFDKPIDDWSHLLQHAFRF